MKNEESKKTKKELSRELKKYSEQGITLWIDDRPGSYKEIAKACVIEEQGYYMRDYVVNDQEEVVELRFHKVINR